MEEDSEQLRFDACTEMIYQKALHAQEFQPTQSTSHFIFRLVLNARECTAYTPPVHRIFNGRFGIECLDRLTYSGLAICGFDIDEIKSEPVLRVNHMPQGAHPKLVTHNIRQRLMLFPFFRDVMLEDILTVARSVGIVKVIITSAFNHPKVKHGELDADTAHRVIDAIALNHGFGYNLEGNLVREY